MVRRRPRPAFTLVEMLVSLAVMAVALAVVTQVFSITTRTAATSAALAEAEALARSFAAQIEADLAGVRPENSMMVIVGRRIAAARTPDDLAAERYSRFLVGDPADVPSNFNPDFTRTSDPDTTQYSDPRADILMFLTERPIGSRAPATNALSAPASDRDFQLALAAGTRFTMSQVVYGHAGIADVSVDLGSGAMAWERLTHIEQNKRPQAAISALPLTRWHLGRRVAIFNPTLTPTYSIIPNVPNDAMTRIVRCISDNPRYAGDSLSGISHVDLLSYFTNTAFARQTPYDAAVGGVPRLDSTAFNVVESLLYPNGDPTFHHVGTVIEDPPAEALDNLGVHMLPGCAWFQVEFLLPEDPRNSGLSPLGRQRGDRPRWVQVDHGKTYVFLPDNVENRAAIRSQIDGSGKTISGSRLRAFAPLDPYAPLQPPFTNQEDNPSNRIVRLWPWAVRVTVRVLDRRGELKDPVIRTIVHRFE